MKRAYHLASWIVLSASFGFAGCEKESRSEFPSENLPDDTARDGGGGGNAGGDAGTPGCKSASDCDDGIACTHDVCESGSCRHFLSASPSACPLGQYCDVTRGCVPGIVCANDEQCREKLGDDPCKTNISCHLVTATCQFSFLDKDGDGHPPVSCGGGDCRDDDPSIHPGRLEVCDGKDNNCNDAVDEGNVCEAPPWCDPSTCPEPPNSGWLKCCTSTNSCGYQETAAATCFPVNGGAGGSGGGGNDDWCGLSQCPQPPYADMYKCCTNLGECGFKTGPNENCYDAETGGGGSGGGFP